MERWNRHNGNGLKQRTATKLLIATLPMCARERTVDRSCESECVAGTRSERKETLGGTTARTEQHMRHYSVEKNEHERKRAMAKYNCVITMTNDCLMQFEESLNRKQIAVEYVQLHRQPGDRANHEWQLSPCTQHTHTRTCIRQTQHQSGKLLDNLTCNRNNPNNGEKKPKKRKKIQKNSLAELTHAMHTDAGIYVHTQREDTQSALNSFTPFVICTAL